MNRLVRGVYMPIGVGVNEARPAKRLVPWLLRRDADGRYWDADARRWVTARHENDGQEAA